MSALKIKKNYNIVSLLWFHHQIWSCPITVVINPAVLKAYGGQMEKGRKEVSKKDSGIAQWLECLAQDRQILDSSPSHTEQTL